RVFVFDDTATSEVYTLSLHDALPIWLQARVPDRRRHGENEDRGARRACREIRPVAARPPGRLSAALCALCGEVAVAPESARCVRSEEHTSELQSRENLVCRLLLEKKK